MDKIKALLKEYSTPLITILVTLAVGLLAGAGIDMSIRPTENKTEVKITSDYSITLAEEQKPAVVENAEGELEEVSAPTVEEIDGNQVLAPEGDLPDLGQGAY